MTFLFRKDMTPIKKLLYAKAMSGGVSLVEATATGNPLSFTTDVVKPLKSLVLPWTLVQSGTGDPSPTNVRPITGVSSLTVSHSGQDTSNPSTYSVVFPALGKNLFDKNAVTANKAWWKGNTSQSVGNNASAKIPVIPGETYTLARTHDRQGTMCYFDENGVYINQDLDHWGLNPSTYAIPSDVYSVGFTVGDSSLDTAMFVKGDSVGSYEPYTNTVYGGSLDVVSGVLTATWKGVVLNGTEYYSKSSTTYTNGVRYNSNSFDDAKVYNNNAMSDKMATLTSVITEVTCICFRIASGSSRTAIYMPDSVLQEQTAEALKAWIAENKPILCYELTDPVTIQLTPQQITALLGDNTIWSDTNGTNTAVYFKKR